MPHLNYVLCGEPGRDQRTRDASMANVATDWNRPIRFVHGAGGHMAALDVTGQARQR